MRKLFTFLLISLIAIQVFALNKGDEITVGKLRYRVSFVYTDKPSEVYCIGKSSASFDNLEIPSYITYGNEKLLVTSVENSAFKGETCFKSIRIGYGIHSINASAFENCTNVTSVYLPSSLLSIYGKAFAGCSSLKSVYYALPDPTGFIMNTDAFPANSGMTLYVNTVKSNAVNLYKAKKAFEKFATITTSGYACDYTDENQLQFVVTTSATANFNGKVTLVGIQNAQSNVVCHRTTPYQFSIYKYDFSAIAPYAFNGKMGIYNVDFSGCTTLTTVGDHAFMNCSDLETINLDNTGVTDIPGYMAFNCQKLTKLSANKATVLGEYALWKSVVLHTLNCPSLQYIHEQAFAYTGMVDIVLPYGLREIHSNAFYNSKTKYLLVPSSCVNVYKSTFKGMSELVELVFNTKYLTKYGSTFTYDMAETPKSCKILVPYGSLDVYNGQFEGFKVKAEGYDFSYGNRHNSKYHMTITSSTPFSLNGVEYAGKAKYVHKDYYSDERSFFSFYAKNYETYKYFDENKKYLITEIEDDCFLNAALLNNVDLSAVTSLERIGNRAFAVTNLTNLTIPASVTSLGGQMFLASTLMKELTILSPELNSIGSDFLEHTASDLKVYVTPGVSYDFCKAVGSTEASKVGVVFTADSEYMPLGVNMPLNFDGTGVTARIVTTFDLGKKILTTKKVTKLKGELGSLLCDLTPGKTYKIPNNGSALANETDYLRTSAYGPLSLEQYGQYGFVWNAASKKYTKPSSGYILPAGMSYLYTPVSGVDSWTLDFLSGTGKSGDVNGDGIVDISDVNIILNIMLGKDTASKYNGRADVTGDGSVDVSDINTCLNIILGS